MSTGSRSENEKLVARYEWFDVVTVHGVTTNHEAIWQPLQRLLSDPSGYKVCLTQFKYDTTALVTGRTAGLMSIDREARRLLRSLTSRRSNSVQTRPIWFFAHDLGGSIVKAALRIAESDSLYQNISRSTQLLTFLGAFHRQRDRFLLQDQLARLILRAQARPARIVRNIHKLHEAVDRVNSDYDLSFLPGLQGILNIHSTYEDITDGYTSTSNCSTLSFEDNIGVPRSHEELCEWNENEHSWLILRDRMQQCSLAKLPAPFGREYSSLCCLTTPLSFERCKPANEHLITWLNAQIPLSDWIQSTTQEILLLRAFTCGALLNGAIYACFMAYQITREKDLFVLHHRFDQHDERKSTTMSMLASFIAHTVRYRLRQLEMWATFLPTWFTYTACWAVSDLIDLFKWLLQNTTADVIIIVEDAHLSDEWFPEFMQRLQNVSCLHEGRCKVIISHIRNAGRDPDSMSTASNHIDLDHMSFELQQDAISMQLSSVLEQRVNAKDMLEAFVALLVQSSCFRQDSRFILEQITAATYSLPDEALAEGIAELSAYDSKQLLILRLHGTRDNDKAWVTYVLRWLMFGFRPMTIYELHDSTAKFDSSNTVTDKIHAILTSLGSLLTIRSGEIRFTSSATRVQLFQLCATKSIMWLSLDDSISTAHSDLAQVCVSCIIQSSNTNSTMEPLDLDCPSHQVFVKPIRNSMIGYSVMSWDKHAQYVSEDGFRRVLCRELLMPSKVRKWWNLAYWALTPPLVRSILPHYAESTALLVRSRLNATEHRSHLTDATGSAVPSTALVEAARSAQHEILEQLIGICSSGECLVSAFEAAACRADACTIAVLISPSRLTQIANDSHVRRIVLCRAIQLGHRDIARMLLCSEMYDKDEHGKTPLELAAFSGRINILTLLLEGAPSTFFDKEALEPALLVACEEGHVEAVGLLRKWQNKFTEANNISNSFMGENIKAAVRNGHAEVLKALIQSGYDRDRFKVHLYESLPLATAEGQRKILQLFLPEADDNKPDLPKLKTLFCRAVRNDDLVLCRLISAVSKGLGRAVAEGTMEEPAIHTAEEATEDVAENVTEGAADKTRQVKCQFVEETAKENFLLHSSVERGGLEMVQFLVDFGASVDIERRGVTPLHRAVVNGWIRITQFLLEKGAAVNHCNRQKWTPIFTAARDGHVELVQLLIDREANVNHRSALGWTPLLLAYDQPKVLQVLLEAGSDINSMVHDTTALGFAVAENRVEAVEVLLHYKPNLEIAFKSGDSALTVAVRNGHVEVMELLLAAGANPSHKSEQDYTALHFVVLRSQQNAVQQERAIKAILEFEVDVNCRTATRNTPLHHIGNGTSVELVRCLINRGADPDAENSSGLTPLCMVLIPDPNFNLPLVRFFIDKRVKLNFTTKEWGSPLHIACLFGGVEQVKTLVDAGADVNSIATNRGTPLQVNMYFHTRPQDYGPSEQITRYLIENGADTSIVSGDLGCALNSACGWAKTSMVQLCLENGASVDASDPVGRKPIHFAAFGNLESLELILAAGGQLGTQDNMGRLPLHFAAVAGNMEVFARMLTELPDTLDAKDVDGWTPLMWAVKSRGVHGRGLLSSDKHLKLIEKILELGADPCIEGKGPSSDWTALKIARFHDRGPDMIQLLETATKIASKTDSWVPSAHMSEKGYKYETAYCDICFTSLVGISYHCDTCHDFDFCAKCYMSSQKVHHSSHLITAIGSEFEESVNFEPETEAEEDDEEPENTNDGMEMDSDISDYYE